MKNQDTNILLTGGKTPATLKMARVLWQQGYTVFVATSSPHHFCRHSSAVVRNFLLPSPRQEREKYLSTLAEIIQKRNISLLIPGDEEVFTIAQNLEQLRKYCPVLTVPFTQLQRLHNNQTFIQKVKQLGLLTPKTWLVKSRQDLRNYLRIPTAPSKLILKPLYPHPQRPAQILHQPVEKLPELDVKAEQPWLLQEFIFGQKYHSYNIAHQGNLTAHAVYSYQSASPLTTFTSLNKPKILHWLKDFLLREKFTGQISLNFIQDEYGDLYPLGCNLKTDPGIYLFRREDNLPKAFLNDTQEIIQPLPGRKVAFALALLLSPSKSLFTKQQLSQWWQTLSKSEEVIFSSADPLPSFHVGLGLRQLRQL